MGSYCVYKHTSPSGKVYIGITGLNPVKRWRNGKGYESNTYFWRAISKYGWDSFTHEIIVSMLTKEEASRIEIDLIAKYKSNDPEYGYNITSGGEINLLPSQSLKKISEKNKGRLFSEEHRKRISEARKKFLAEHPEKAATRKGYKMTEDHKHKLSEAAKKARSLKIQCIETGAVYSSMTEASRATGANLSSLSEMLHGKQRSVLGLTWRFVEVVE